MSPTVTTPNELEIRVERLFDAPRTHVYSVWTCLLYTSDAADE